MPKAQRREGAEPWRFVILGEGPDDETRLYTCYVPPDQRVRGGKYSMCLAVAVYRLREVRGCAKLLDQVLDPLSFDLDGTAYTVRVKATEEWGEFELRLVRSAEPDQVLARTVLSVEHSFDPSGKRVATARTETGQVFPVSLERRTCAEILGWKAWVGFVLGQEPVFGIEA